MDDAASLEHYRCAQWVGDAAGGLIAAGTTSDGAAAGELHALRVERGVPVLVAAVGVEGEATCLARADGGRVWMGTSRGRVALVAVTTDVTTDEITITVVREREVVSAGVDGAAITALIPVSAAMCLVGTECGSLGTVELKDEEDASMSAAPVHLPACPKLCQLPVTAFAPLSFSVYAGITPRALFLYDAAQEKMVLGPMHSEEGSGAGITCIASRYGGCELFVGARTADGGGRVDVMDVMATGGHWGVEMTSRLALPLHQPHVKGWHPVGVAFTSPHRVMIAYNTGCVSRADVVDASGSAALSLNEVTPGDNALGDALSIIGTPVALTAIDAAGAAAIVATRGCGVLLVDAAAAAAAAAAADAPAGYLPPP